MKLNHLNRLSKFKNLSNSEFKLLQSFLLKNFGIEIRDEKKMMLEFRLNKRLNNLGLSCFSEYINYLLSTDGSKCEMPKFLDTVTTHKTEFFREGEHFKILEQIIVKEFYEKGKKFFNIWSAGCSSGEEVYSLAMTLQNFIDNKGLKIDYHIIGTDISEEMIKLAKIAIYKEEKTDNINLNFKKKFLLKSKDKNKKLVKIIPELRKKVSFRVLNLIDELNFREKFDIIFCRNVAIYFNEDTQGILFRNLLKWLNSGGFLFLGHSESLFGYNLPVKKYFSSVYMKI
jgi:chemotaxis protein methyltransferase CheR